ncbi:cupin domain-containing protein [Paraburkholderia sp. Ac-20342]|nr:cupin domain-containing protein [Paraburkholderia sp. Ac-20342]NIF54120.1 cupin domain-containing protein [Burkholderia sp. Ax-1724]NIF77767.1 cupin domain-containing protein [Paraburkholderia sp. Cy-641]
MNTAQHPLPAVMQSTPPEYIFMGVRMRVLLSSAQTGGQFSMIEGIMPPGGDGGLHIHHREDESMFIIEGEMEVTIGDKVEILSAGSSYFAPRGVPQRLRNLGEKPVRCIVTTTPGGFDEFIAQAGIPLDGAAGAGAAEIPAQPPTPEQMAGLLRLAESFGIEILLPPGA